MKSFKEDAINSKVVVEESDENGKIINLHEVQPYVPSPKLVQAVNLSILLKRPLLVMGEPGCGKTQLAEAIAFQWYGKEFYKYFFKWNIKSTSVATDGIYVYDPLTRLRATQFDSELIVKEKTLSPPEKDSFYLEQGYLKKGPLRRSIDKSSAKNPCILLIDEIDKADNDFPNDLLLELENFIYEIPETGFRSPVKEKEDFPLIIITSNNEKELPPAFLRRCIFHYIQFPSAKQLAIILEKRFSIETDSKLSQKAISAFQMVRNQLASSLSSKSISTSELIDWFEVLQIGMASKSPLTLNGKPLEKELDKAIKNLQQGKSTSLPFHQVLLKNWPSISSILPTNE